MTEMIKKEFSQIFFISLSVEVATSLWKWLRAPSDALHVLYNYNFLTYEELYYFLTPEGGARWETVARPD